MTSRETASAAAFALAPSNYTHETVPTHFVEAEGVGYAYRRFGKAGTIPLR